ncbi:MAG: hypothetical protein ACXACG_00100 [Candidatus Thorarchaeota archaeon]|jgi:DNA-binding transcriptional regulator GbsR (MarR family)
MKLEKIKHEFVHYMEEVRATEPYPRNFIGCLFSIIIESEPVSQERIMTLTGYSQATVSLILQKLQLLMPIRKIRKIGDRKNYYTYEDSPERFVLDLWRKRLESQAISYQYIESMLVQAKEPTDHDSSLKRFVNYLQNMLLYLDLIRTLREQGIDDFKILLDTRSSEIRLPDPESLESGMLDNFLHSIREISYTPESGSASKESLRLKNDYFSGFKTELNPLFSQAGANQMIVIHSVFLEGSTTQEQLEKITLLPRSTISEVLTRGSKLGLIKVRKSEGSRIKIYEPAVSFTDLMLGNFYQIEMHVDKVKPRLKEFIKQTRKLGHQSKEVKQFLDILASLETAYSFTQDYSRLMKIKMVEQLKEAYDNGFVFL